MVKKLVGALLMSLFSSSASHAAPEGAKTAYDFAFKTLRGEAPMPLAQFKGKVLLIVNTASQCGFTKQYEGLEKLYQEQQGKGLVVIGVPSNDFGGQEPGSSEEIANFCKLNYGVSFPMTSKQVVSGDGAHPFYQWARTELGFGTAPKWNFHKYLVNRQGKLVDHFNSTTSPDSEGLRKAIDAAIEEK